MHSNSSPDAPRLFLNKSSKFKGVDLTFVGSGHKLENGTIFTTCMCMSQMSDKEGTGRIEARTRPSETSVNFLNCFFQLYFLSFLYHDQYDSDERIGQPFKQETGFSNSNFKLDLSNLFSKRFSARQLCAQQTITLAAFQASADGASTSAQRTIT